MHPDNEKVNQSGPAKDGVTAIGLQIVKIEENQPAVQETSEPEKMIEVPEAQLKTLLADLKEYRAKEELIKEVAMDALKAFNLLDPQTGKLLEPTAGQTQASILINAIKDKVSIAGLLFNSEKELERLGKDFGFFGKLSKIFESYAK